MKKITDTSRNKTVLYWAGTYDYTVNFFNENKQLKIGCEVGIAGGNHIKTLLENTKIEKIYGVDPYIKTSWDMDLFLDVDNIYGGFDRLYEEVVDMLSVYDDRVEVIRKTSQKAASNFKNESLDFVFIDAMHTYEDCLDDIKIWEPKVKPGGFVMGHDWEHDSFPGVEQAVREYFNNKKINGVGSPVHVWYVQK